MKLYSKSEIKNKHDQPIYMFSKQTGNTELEKYINFLNAMKVKFIKLTTTPQNTSTITCIVIAGNFCVFNNQEELINRCEDFVSKSISNLSIIDLLEDLSDMNILV